jgi:hypothetical protein
MTRPTLTVVEGGGEPKPDETVIEGRKDAVSALENATAWWVCARYEGGGYAVRSYGPDVTLNATVEEVSREMKLEALGLFDGDDE